MWLILNLSTKNEKCNNKVAKIGINPLKKTDKVIYLNISYLSSYGLIIYWLILANTKYTFKIT